MIGVLLLLAGLWALGAAFGTPRRSRLMAMAAVWALAGVGLAALPAGQTLRRILGDDLRVWAAVTILAVLGLGYAWLLTRLKARAMTDQPKTAPSTFTPAELDRYARHILLREIGGPGQKALLLGRRFR
mgnify:FL=1